MGARPAVLPVGRRAARRGSWAGRTAGWAPCRTQRLLLPEGCERRSGLPRRSVQRRAGPAVLPEEQTLLPEGCERGSWPPPPLAAASARDAIQGNGGDGLGWIRKLTPLVVLLLVTEANVDVLYYGGSHM